jgi:putative transcriptional regulator
VETDKIWGYEFEKDKGIKSGRLLLAEPFMMDENFRRTVVLVCDHNYATGTVGLILNKPINLRLTEVVEDFPEFKAKLFLGGPVGTDTLQFLHRLGDEIEGSLQLSQKLFWGGNFEQLKTMIEKRLVASDDVRFFLGYSGWSFGQLDEELKSNSWVVTDAGYKHIFETPADNLWKEVMKNMGGVYNTMAGYPENPTLN